MTSYIEQLSYQDIYMVKVDSAIQQLCSRCVEIADGEGSAVQVITEAAVDACERCGYLTPRGALRQRHEHEQKLADVRPSPDSLVARDFDERTEVKKT
jgi:NMD protein affecting ribosome stability and mRNA decay